jgi:hypothetical protein
LLTIAAWYLNQIVASFVLPTSEPVSFRGHTMDLGTGVSLQRALVSGTIYPTPFDNLTLASLSLSGNLKHIFLKTL